MSSVSQPQGVVVFGLMGFLPAGVIDPEKARLSALNQPFMFQRNIQNHEIVGCVSRTIFGA
jgi:hypothetical protein